MTENKEIKKAALQLKAMVMCTSINGNYSCSDCVNEQNCRKDEYNTDKDFEKSAIIIFDALEELEAYRAIGTVDEFKALKEKATPKEPIIIDNRLNDVEWKCPVCGLNVIEEPPCQEYCQRCGNKLDWSE